MSIDQEFNFSGAVLRVRIREDEKRRLRVAVRPPRGDAQSAENYVPANVEFQTQVIRWLLSLKIEMRVTLELDSIIIENLRSERLTFDELVKKIGQIAMVDFVIEVMKN